MRLKQLIVLSLVSAGCARPLSVGSGPASALERIAAVSREFSARYERGDAAGQAAIYTDDGVIFPPGRAAIKGRAAIEEYWRLPAGRRILRHRVTADSVVIVGNTAYDWGTFTVRSEQNGQESSGGGKYVIVWREVAPGDWRMHLDMWNSGPPAQPPR
jgi:ketosteroid isomerase-like protein